MPDRTTKALVPLLCPFTVVIDSREQLGYSFADIVADAHEGRRPVTVPLVRACLDAGDYSIQGLEDHVAVERKSAADLFSTLGQSRARFVRELERLNRLDFAAVMVEAEWSEIYLRPPERSQLRPKTILRSVIAWQHRFPRVGWWFVPGRLFAECLTFRILERAWKEEQKRKACCTTEVCL